MRTSIALLLLMGCLTPLRSAAQSGERVRGAWLHLGGGGGLLSSRDWGHADGMAGGLIAGWTRSAHVRLGVTVRGWMGDTKETRGAWTTSGGNAIVLVAPVVAVYPWSGTGAYTFGGAGLGAETFGLGRHRTGMGAFLGAGFDLPTQGSALTAGPYVDHVWTSSSGARYFELGLALHYGARRAQRSPAS